MDPSCSVLLEKWDIVDIFGRQTVTRGYKVSLRQTLPDLEDAIADWTVAILAKRWPMSQQKNSAKQSAKLGGRN